MKSCIGGLSVYLSLDTFLVLPSSITLNSPISTANYIKRKAREGMFDKNLYLSESLAIWSPVIKKKKENEKKGKENYHHNELQRACVQDILFAIISLLLLIVKKCVSDIISKHIMRHAKTHLLGSGHGSDARQLRPNLPQPNNNSFVLISNLT
jgi:hypothetical protein